MMLNYKSIPQRILAAIITITVALVLAIVLIVRCSADDDDGPMVIHNTDLLLMSVNDLEYVATNSKSDRDKREALYLLFEKYKTRSLITLYEFYQHHKGDQYTDEAYHIVRLRCDSLYRVALSTDTEQGWSDYLVTVPEDFYRDAQDRYLNFKWSHTAEAWDTEEKAWSEVQRLKGKSAYERYIKLYPHGEHIAPANYQLSEIKRQERIREQNLANDRIRYQRWLKKINRQRQGWI